MQLSCSAEIAKATKEFIEKMKANKKENKTNEGEPSKSENAKSENKEK